MADDKGAALASRQAEIDLAKRAILDGEKIEQHGDPEAISRAIAQRVSQAATAEAVLTPQALPAWGDNLHRPALLHGFRLNPSGFEQGSSVYAAAEVEWLDDGTRETVSCGGRNALMQMVRLLELDALPAKVKLIARGTSGGFDAFWLVAA